jgi:phospholipid/cholesterol/gamma-HCH transport system substrate-binding protein
VSPRAHPRLIGAFVVLGAVLALAAVVLLSSGRLLSRRDRFAVFFPGSVQGLKAGAPVTFRGIPIGEVEGVRGILTGREAEIQIEVVMEIQRDRIQGPAEATDLLGRMSARELADYFIARGIKAEMQSQSLLTGQKLIELDFHRDTPGRLTGLPSRYPELPTVPGSWERLGSQLGNRLDDVLAKVAEFPIDEATGLVKDTRRAFDGIGDLMESGSVKGAADGIGRSTREMERTLQEVDVAVTDVRQTLTELRGEIKTTAAQTRDVLARADKSVAALERGADGAARLQPDLARTLGELSEAASSLRALLEYLQQHPEAVLSGKPAEGGK